MGLKKFSHGAGTTWCNEGKRSRRIKNNPKWNAFCNRNELTWLKKNCSCSLARLIQACSKLFFSKCSKPKISRIPKNSNTNRVLIVKYDKALYKWGNAITVPILWRTFGKKGLQHGATSLKLIKKRFWYAANVLELVALRATSVNKSFFPFQAQTKLPLATSFPSPGNEVGQRAIDVSQSF